MPKPTTQCDEAEERAAILSVAPTSQPGAGCPVPAKPHYTREEGYQLLQWEDSSHETANP